MNTVQLKVVIAALITGFINKYLGKIVPADMIGDVANAVSVLVFAGITGLFFRQNTVIADTSTIPAVEKIKVTPEVAAATPDAPKVTT